MAFRLAIDNRVAVTVKGKIPGASRGTHTNFNFTLDMERMTQPQLTEALSSGDRVDDFLASKTAGWEGQRLVLDEGGNPAAFSEEAFRELLKVPGMTVHVLQAYTRDLGVQEKN
jgi:hypothetical protein